MKRFNAGIDKYFKAIMAEIRGGLTQTPLHMLKTLVIMFIPFFYAFTYLWAFYDPIDKANNLNLNIITSRDDALGEFVKAKAEGDEGITIQNGPNVKITAGLDQIYDDEVKGPLDETNKFIQNSLLTINVPKMDQVIVEMYRDAARTWEAAKAAAATGQTAPTYFDSLVKSLTTFVTGNTLNGKPTIDYNYKKNFLIGFATDISSAQSGGLNAVIGMMIDAVTQSKGNVLEKMIIGDINPDGVVTGNWITADGTTIERSFRHHQWAASGADPAHPVLTQTQYDDFFAAMTRHFEAIKDVVSPDGGLIKNAPGTSNENSSKGIEIIRLHSQLGTDGHEDFGIGLSPFFISIGMWFGAVAMTVLIHRKIYDRSTLVRWRYMAKGTLINAGILIQASILMISLKFIGLDVIGYNHWAIMFGTAIFAGIVFATFIMAIRLSIPSRALSIYIIVIFMVLNIVCSGGLFPIPTQNVFVRAMNTWLPMHFSVEMLRQGLVDTNWIEWAKCFGYLSIYLLFVPIGAMLNAFYTHRWYIRHGYVMPKNMQNYHDKWLKHRPKRNAAIVKRLKKSGNKTKRKGDI